MLIPFRSKPAMQTYRVDTGYLQEEDAFDVNQLVEDWVPARNPFLKRSAANSVAGSHGCLPTEEFVQWAGEYALSLPIDSAVHIDLQFARDANGLRITYTVGQCVPGVIPPIEADNPGFLSYALNWFSERKLGIRVFVCSGLFWVEKQD